MESDTVLSARVYYADGSRAEVGPGWTIIFDVRAGTVAAAIGTTKGFWGRPRSVVDNDDKLLLAPGGFAAGQQQHLGTLARSFAQRFGCRAERLAPDARQLPLHGLVAFTLVPAAA